MSEMWRSKIPEYAVAFSAGAVVITMVKRWLERDRPTSDNVFDEIQELKASLQDLKEKLDRSQSSLDVLVNNVDDHHEKFYDTFSDADLRRSSTASRLNPKGSFVIDRELSLASDTCSDVSSEPPVSAQERVDDDPVGHVHELQHDQHQDDMLLQVSDGDLYLAVDELRDSNHKEKAYDVLMQKRDSVQNTNSVELLWRLARASCDKANMDAENNQRLLETGCEYATKALEHDETCGDAHKWLAIGKGSLGDFMTTKEKIKMGHIYKNEVMLAIKYKPSDPVLYNLLGRWHYNIAGLSWLERNAAKALFGNMPDGSFKEALELLEKCETMMSKPWIGNTLLTAQVHHKMKNDKLARVCCDKAINFPVTTADDQKEHDEAVTFRTLLG
eukprot:m.159162 g.159162  ORF g.159162 m.159162 type:complete len:387 (-) comp31123_c0_seq1:361-1521(-)